MKKIMIVIALCLAGAPLLEARGGGGGGHAGGGGFHGGGYHGGGHGGYDHGGRGGRYGGYEAGFGVGLEFGLDADDAMYDGYYPEEEDVVPMEDEEGPAAMAVDYEEGE